MLLSAIVTHNTNATVNLSFDQLACMSVSKKLEDFQARSPKCWHNHIWICFSHCIVIVNCLLSVNAMFLKSWSWYWVVKGPSFQSPDAMWNMKAQKYYKKVQKYWTSWNFKSVPCSVSCFRCWHVLIAHSKIMYLWFCCLIIYVNVQVKIMWKDRA